VSAPIRPLARLQRPVFLLNSWQSLFTAARLHERLFSRSYEAILPNSLTKILPFALVYSTHLPVSVCGTGGNFHRPHSFSCPNLRSLLGLHPGITDLLRLPPQSTQRLTFPQGSVCSPLSGTGILTGCPSPTLFSLGLGLTNPTRTDLPSEPLDVRRVWFAQTLRYSCQHSHSCTLQHRLPRCLLRLQDALLP
jgi:hypothetical protein